MKVYFAADHAGYALKEILKPFVQSLGYEIEDVGAHALDMNDDYPVFIQAAARKVAEDTANSRGIVIGGSGQGEAFAANRIKGVRAVVYYGEPARKQIDAGGKELDMISSTREHNNSNVLSLGGRFLIENEAKAAVKKWLSTGFSGEERHTRRIEMISFFEKGDIFDQWGTLKRRTHNNTSKHFFREGDVVFMRMGKNIGFEQDGKGDDFARPVLVVRKFNQDVFFGIALTTHQKKHPLYVSIGSIEGLENIAILSQGKLYDQRRAIRKIGHVPQPMFLSLKQALREALHL